MTPLIHGGDIYSASKQYDIPLDNWVDLSTGINPISYPCSNIPLEAFSRLPYQSQQFKKAVKRYYGNHNFVSLAGSQEVIRSLPSLLESLPIILPSIGYQEHHDAWTNSGSTTKHYDACSPDIAESHISHSLSQNAQQHLLIINPNNPSGLLIAKERLLEWASIMQGGARLIVDEAFIDLHPQSSLLNSETLPSNILVLRSCGKFFGLGGIRAGFLFGSSSALSDLSLPHNPWPINGAAQHILCKALTDENWHNQARNRIKHDSSLTEELFEALGLTLLSNQGLFLSYYGHPEQLRQLYETFAKAGILLRLIPVNSSLSILRVGILANDDQSSILRVKNCIEHASRR